MKKVFNASLIAASLALAFGVNAATLTPASTAKKLSAEGVAAGIAAQNENLVIDVAVEKLHPANSKITLTFDAGIDVSSFADGAVDNSNAGSTGQGFTGTDGSTPGDILFDYGTGSFTFDNVVIDEDDNSISFAVNLGGPLQADSAFRVTLVGANFGMVNVAYASETVAGVAIDSAASTAVTETTSQFSFSVATKFDGLINRTDLDAFVVTAPALATDDQLQFKIRNKPNLIATIDNAVAKVAIDGKFTDLVVADDFTASVGTLSGLTAGALANTVLWTSAAGFSTPGAESTVDIDFSLVTAVDIPETGQIEVSFTYSGDGDDLEGDNVAVSDTVYVADLDGGEWRLNAAIVHVPYLPLGYADLSPTVEVTNMSGSDAEIQVEAYGKTTDQAKVAKYDRVTLAKKAKANGITTITGTDLRNAFGVAVGSNEKVSVRFIVDADDADITLAPYYRDLDSDSRVNIVTDQYKK